MPAIKRTHRLAPRPEGYRISFRADYQCMKCGFMAFKKHPVMLTKCPACGKNSWRRHEKTTGTAVEK